MLALILAIGQAKCAGERSGVLSEQLRSLKEREAVHKKAAKLLMDSVATRDKQIASLNARLPQKVTRYVQLRDTLLVQDSGSVPIAQVIPVLQAADSVIEVQGRIIGVLSAQNTLLRAVVTAQDSAIQSLNRSLRLAERVAKPPFLSRVASTTTKLAVGAVIGAVAWEAVR